MFETDNRGGSEREQCFKRSFGDKHCRSGAPVIDKPSTAGSFIHQAQTIPVRLAATGALRKAVAPETKRWWRGGKNLGKLR